MTDQPSPGSAIDPEIIGMFTGYLDSSFQARDATCAAVLKRGHSAVPTLIAMLNKEIDSPPWPADHADKLIGTAAMLLGQLGHPDAIGPLIKAFSRTGTADHTYDLVRDALGDMGAPALEPLLDAFHTLSEHHHRMGAALALGSLGVKDERVFQLLLEVLKQDPFCGAYALKAYGDPRAVPHLRQAFDDYDANARFPDLDPRELDAEVEGDIEALQAALEAFGVELSEEEIEAKLGPPDDDDDMDDDDMDDDDMDDDMDDDDMDDDDPDSSR